MIDDKELKIYRCPFCDRVLFKGFVLSLAMVCHNCNELVRIDEKA
ncbi:hypothetical protein [Desulfobacula sp.]|nr:hypothetical protein [Desulfobacula sp.]